MDTSVISQINIPQLISTTLALTAAGVVGFAIKDIPLKIYSFLFRQFTTRLTLTSANKSYHDLMKYIEIKYKNKNFRDFKLTNGRYGYEENSTMGIGYGAHFIKFKNTIMRVQLIKETATGTQYDKDTIVVTKWGRKRKEFDEFFNELGKELVIEDNIPIYKMVDSWYPINKIPKRPLDTMFMEKSKKDILFNTITNFINKEDWYVENGIPYHLGILLYGSPGTGKSSLIKALTGYFNYSLYYLPVSKLFKIEDALSNVPKNSIVVIEDIDCDKAIHNRSSDTPNIISTGSVVPEPIQEEFSITNFSDVLNSLDGIASSHGRIILFTTNHIEKLDPALLRPGRVDLKVEIGFVNNEIFNQFTTKFFGKVEENIQLKENLTCAELQNLVLQNKTFEDVVEFARIG